MAETLCSNRWNTGLGDQHISLLYIYIYNTGEFSAVALPSSRVQHEIRSRGNKQYITHSLKDSKEKQFRIYTDTNLPGYLHQCRILVTWRDGPPTIDRGTCKSKLQDVIFASGLEDCLCKSEKGFARGLLGIFVVKYPCLVIITGSQ